MPQDAVSVVLLGELEAALGALAPEEERALRLRFGLGVLSDWEVPVSADQARILEARGLMKLRLGSIEAEGRRGRRGTRCAPKASAPGGTTRRPPISSSRTNEESPPRPEQVPEPPSYEVTGWDEV